MRKTFNRIFLLIFNFVLLSFNFHWEEFLYSHFHSSVRTKNAEQCFVCWQTWREEFVKQRQGVWRFLCLMEGKIFLRFKTVTPPVLSCECKVGNLEDNCRLEKLSLILASDCCAVAFAKEAWTWKKLNTCTHKHRSSTRIFVILIAMTIAKISILSLFFSIVECYGALRLHLRHFRSTKITNPLKAPSKSHVPWSNPISKKA